MFGPGGVWFRGGVPSQVLPPPPRGQKDACKLITLPQTSFAGGNNWERFCLQMAAVENWDDAPVVAEVPEIKLFGKWSADEVQVSDISLTVSMICFEMCKM